MLDQNLWLVLADSETCVTGVRRTPAHPRHWQGAVTRARGARESLPGLRWRFEESPVLLEPPAEVLVSRHAEDDPEPGIPVRVVA